MKAANIKTSGAKTSKAVKALVTGLIINALITLVTTVFLAVLLNLSGNLFEDFAGYIMLLPLISGGYFGGLISAKINGAKGLMLGTLCGAIKLILMLIIGFAAYNTDITYMFLLKTACELVSSAIGGIKGVNKKEKFKI